MKVAYQGVSGAYSEAAIYKYFDGKPQAVGYGTFEEVFEAVKGKKADYGLVPVENTIAGSVAANYDLFLKHDVYVMGEVLMDISHNLLAIKGASINGIKAVYSHPHALEQCREFIRKHKLKAVPEYDTAGAAKIVKERGQKDEAAIASEFCAKIYGLEVIEKNISTATNNITKFFVFVDSGSVPEGLKQEKTSIVFSTKHYPGALINCLQRLAKHGVNLTKLESRPIPDNPWEYVFYADLEGGIGEENVKLALSEMEASSNFLKILGSYPKAK